MADIFTLEGAARLNLYMFSVMVLGTVILSKVNGRLSNMSVRKLFHLMAFALFFPGVASNVLTPSLSIEIDQVDDLCLQ